MSDVERGKPSHTPPANKDNETESLREVQLTLRWNIDHEIMPVIIIFFIGLIVSVACARVPTEVTTNESTSIIDRSSAETRLAETVSVSVKATVSAQGTLTVQSQSTATEQTLQMIREVQATSASLTRLAATAPAKATTDAIIAFTGLWVNEDNNTRSIPQIYLFTQGNRLIAHAWGVCHPDWCDWNLAEAKVAGSNATIFWDFGFEEVQMTLTLIAKRLEMRTHTHFKDNSGRSDYDSYNRYYKTAQPTVTPGPP